MNALQSRESARKRWIRKGLRLEDWPDADRCGFEAATRNGPDLFDDSGDAAHLKPSSRKILVDVYGLWLAYLMSVEPAALDERPDARVTPLRIEGFVRAFESTSRRRTLGGYIRMIRRVVLLLQPGAEVAWIRDLAHRLEVNDPVATSTVTLTSADLWNAAVRVLRRTELQMEAGNTKVGIARDYRDALIIAFLAMIPLRRRNLAQLEIGTSLIRSGTGWLVQCSDEQTKTNNVITFEVPPLLAPWLDRYLLDVRPLFRPATGNEALWVSHRDRGTAVSYSHIYPLFRNFASKHLGLTLSPHSVRHIAATTWAIHTPEQARGASALLGHDDPNVVDRHYKRAGQIQAGRVLQKLVRTLRI